MTTDEEWNPKYVIGQKCTYKKVELKRLYAYCATRRESAKALKKKEMEEAKKLREEDEARKAKEERRAKRAAAIEAGQDLAELGLEESEEEEIKVDDLSIDEFILEPGNKVDNFFLLNFPHTEENIKRLKEHGINFDRIIFLNENNEEEPGKFIT